MEPDRLTWLQRLTRTCDHTISQLEHRGDPLLSPLIDDIQQLRDRLQTQIDSDAG